MTGTNSSGRELVTAAVLVIGDEILSGRTKDKNIGYIAEYLTALGIDLKEVRVVGDIEAEIVTTVNARRFPSARQACVRAVMKLRRNDRLQGWRPNP